MEIIFFMLIGINIRFKVFLSIAGFIFDMRFKITSVCKKQNIFLENPMSQILPKGKQSYNFFKKVHDVHFLLKHYKD